MCHLKWHLFEKGIYCPASYVINCPLYFFFSITELLSISSEIRFVISKLFVYLHIYFLFSFYSRFHGGRNSVLFSTKYLLEFMYCIDEWMIDYYGFEITHMFINYWLPCKCLKSEMISYVSLHFHKASSSAIHIRTKSLLTILNSHSDI